MAVPHGRSTLSLEGPAMHWIVTFLLALPLALYVARRTRRGKDLLSLSTTAATQQPKPLSDSGSFGVIAIVLALPFLVRAAIVVLTILALIYVYFFGPIKPIHEWMP
jgi:hypothetical protein